MLANHTQDVPLSVDNYNTHITSILLNNKQRVDNTFDYEEELGESPKRPSMQW